MQVAKCHSEFISSSCFCSLTPGRHALNPWPAEGVYDYAHAVRRQLRKAGFHVDVDVADRKMQKKVGGRMAWGGVRMHGLQPGMTERASLKCY